MLLVTSGTKLVRVPEIPSGQTENGGKPMRSNFKIGTSENGRGSNGSNIIFKII